MSKCPFNYVDEQGKVFVPPSHPLRSDIPAPPAQMQHLPIDERGYPVPFFVAWTQHKPEFRGSSRQVQRLCIEKSLCWVCGLPLRGEMVFTIGPMCSVNRLSAEPPSHIACARYSVRACPFLSKPQMVRREDGLPERLDFGAGISLRHNPGVTLLWFARAFTVEYYPEGALWRIERQPVLVEWWARGRKATRDEVVAAFEGGLPKLRALATEEGSLESLEKQVSRAMRLVPR